jgi:hypothetical protein
MRNEFEINDVNLDRLVDGEMDDAEYRQFLQGLEDHPDGWRRCAMSFLEQQALQRDLRQIMANGDCLDRRVESEAAPPPNKIAPLLAKSARQKHWMADPWVRWTSVVAVGLLAFACGMLLRPDRASSPNNMNTAIVQEDPEPAPSDFSLENTRLTRADILIDDPIDGSRHEINVPVQTIGHDQSLSTIAPDHLPRSLYRALQDSESKNIVERGILVSRNELGEVVMIPFDRITPLDAFQ